MKAKIEALNKTYLVEFKDEDQFVSFLTKHNDDVNNVEIINEESLPELNKSVEVAKPSMSDGWKTLEKSAFVQKEKGVEKKGMTLGGKYAEFKYEPDKTLDASADDKVSEPKNDSPALTGDEPKAANVESTAKENEVKNTTPKTDAPKKEESSEESKEDDSEDKEEVKEAANPDRATKRKLCDIVAENGFDDSEYCFHIFDCMSPESQEKFLRKHNYEDIGYAYDGDRELAYNLIDAMNSEDLAKCKVMIEKWKVEEDEYEDIDESVEDNSISEDYKEGYIAGQESYDMGHYVPADESDAESEEFERGYEDGYEDAKAGINKFDDKGEHRGPFNEEEYDGEDENDEKIDETVDQILSEEEKEEVRDYFKDIVKNIKEYPNYESMIAALRSLNTENIINDEQYDYCIDNWDIWLAEFSSKDEDIEEKYKKPDNDGDKDYTDIEEDVNELNNTKKLSEATEEEKSEVEKSEVEKAEEEKAEEENNESSKIENKLEKSEEDVEINKIKRAKNWVLKATVQLQTLKKGKIASIKKRDLIAKELANAAAIAFDTPVINILRALQKDNKFFSKSVWK